MNIYDDYQNYLKEMEPLLTLLEKTNSPILLVLQDVIKVTEHISQLYQNKSKIDADLEETFDLGFGYLTNVLADLKLYYSQYFHEDISIMNDYSSLILYHIYVDDFKWYLDNEELLTEERKHVINHIEDIIDQILANQTPFDEELMNHFEQHMVEITPSHDSFRPVYAIFSMISEELNLI